MAVLDVLEQERLLEHAVVVGRYVADGLEELQSRYELIGDVRDLGMFFAVDLVSDRASKEPATAETKRIVNMMRDRGVLISQIGRHDSILKMRPPMPFTKDNADLLLSTLDECFAAL